MDRVEEIILELYNNENISIGVHGTSVLPDKERRNVDQILQSGLMCRYGDIRRTVALQDRGHIHAHGNISFEDVISYEYGKGKKGYVYQKYREGKNCGSVLKEIELEQCTYILGVPKEMNTTDEELFLGGKKRFGMEYARTPDDLRLGNNKELIGRTIDPKYIIGYYMNGDISTFKYNSAFYGFKEEDGVLTVDWEKIQQENERVKKRNAEKIEKPTQDLGRETIGEQKKTKSKSKVSNLLNKLVDLCRKKTDRMRDD